jgi:predicted dehydrogenase
MIAACIGLNDAGVAHARAFAVASNCELAGVYDADAAVAAKIGTSLGVPVFTSPNDLLKTAKPDLVVVRVPLPERTTIVRNALTAGCHVISATPISEDDDELASIAELARKKGLACAGDFHLRFNPAMDASHRWIAEGQIGIPLFINGSLCNGIGDMPDDLFFSLGAHGVDILRSFVGEVTHVQCFHADSGQSAQVNLRFANDCVGNLTLSHEQTMRHPFARLEYAGKVGRLTIENVYEEATLFVHDNPDKIVTVNSIFGGVPQLSQTYGFRSAALIAAIEAGDIDKEVDDVVAAQRIMRAAVQSAETGEVIEI